MTQKNLAVKIPKNEYRIDVSWLGPGRLLIDKAYQNEGLKPWGLTGRWEISLIVL